MEYRGYSVRCASQDELLVSQATEEEVQAYYDTCAREVMVFDQDGYDVTDAFEANAPWNKDEPYYIRAE